ncbi:hypothetical protein QJS04_geneDACA020659 [Acorus gramineus]|uniref:Spt6 SH2 domain-containing protein n=1 Tax=Acorus gramineus TaxID=55184 RepID=A0AAV9BVM6_ACOGR|nr:hypothetical protein QJS04_geneDACA020659 [Acorus gramineus]
MVKKLTRRGSKSEVDDLLRAEKAEYPMRIVYAFGISHEYPGTFILSYIRSLNPHHKYIGLYPKGLKFRKVFFKDIDRLVNYFQKNINKPPPGEAHSLPSVAARSTVRSHERTSGATNGSACMVGRITFLPLKQLVLDILGRT